MENIDSGFAYEPTYPLGILVKHRQLNEAHKVALER